MSWVDYLQAPFPYFGGKSAVASIIWEALGDVKHYIEPFFGSGAVLLRRPNYDSTKHVETVNDKDAFLCNVWRSLQFAPDEVAKWCDYPVNHADLHARRNALLKNASVIRDGVLSDPEWYDAKLAGYWIWCTSAWIGSDMLSTERYTGLDICKRPDISHGGRGINKLAVRKSNTRQMQRSDTLCQIPFIGHGGRGVHKVGMRGCDNESEESVCGAYNTTIYKWFRALSERLRYVRVTCKDWKCVCQGEWHDLVGYVGFFLDPPYEAKNVSRNLYMYDESGISREVMQWALEKGSRERYRIVIAGYEEYEELLSHGWTLVSWKSNGGYATSGNSDRKYNRFRERLYISPHCKTTKQLSLGLT